MNRAMRRRPCVKIPSPLQSLRREIRCLVVFALLSAGLSTVVAAEPGQSVPPNIILIMADDLGAEALGSYGAADYRTPHLDQLAAEGLRFTQCHSQPLCTPSRVQLMTGKYNVRNYTTFGRLESEERTFGHDLRELGYATAIAGKWQLGGDRNSIDGFGFDEHLLWWLEAKSWRYGNVGNLILNREVRPGGRGEYGPEVVNDFVLDFISRHRDQPFFVYYPMMLVHAPFVPTPLSTDARDPQEQHVRYFADMVEYMDLMVGRVVEQLEKLGLRENTLLIFLGDNGTHDMVATRMIDGSVVVGGKRGTHDSSTRVPMIVSWPSVVPRGLVSEALVDFSDFVPTLVDVAGGSVDAARDLDGVSLLPVFKGQRRDVREWSYCWYAEEGREENVIAFARDKRYKLYRDGRFFDVPADPDERQPLDVAHLSEPARQARQSLQAVIDRYNRVEAMR